jgi:restriction endonuclease
MAKKQSAGEAAAEAAKKRRPQKKSAAPKAGAKKPPPKPAPRPARRPARKPAQTSAQAELPMVAVDVVEDAAIVRETPVTPVLHADLAASQTEEVIEVDDQAPALSPEEQEISAMYSDELSKPAIAHAEYTDRLTADEDRPMVPEINARDERKHQWQERRDRRRQRRDERSQQRHDRQGPGTGQGQGAGQGQGQSAGQGQGQGQGAGQGQGPRPPHAGPRPDHRSGESRGAEPRPPHAAQPPRPVQSPVAPVAAINGQEADALARVGTPLGDAAATVFAQLRNGQPLPVRQLAAMMRKRNLIEIDPEQAWPQLKAELLGDERSYRTLGLRPRIVYRGRDLFAPGPVSMSQTADAEANVASALSRLASATHRALAGRIARATGAGFERLIHAYLVAAGFREIAWVKRVDGIAYAQAIAPGIDRLVLISARSGDQPIDRRGIGELRVGVEAKDLVAGILFSARELSEDAERELERAGRSISVMCGDQLVAALIATGVGVVSAAAPLRYVDDQLLDELLAG